MKRCKFSLVVVMLGSFFGTPAADARTFTNTAGKTINAELVELNNKTAVLKLDNGKQAKVPLDALSKDDQVFINSWWEKNKNNVSEHEVRISISRKATPIREAKSDDDKKNKKDDKSKKISTVYTCTLSSYSKRTINNIKADYTVYKNVSTRGEGGSKSSTEEITKSATVELLESHKTAEFKTTAVECVSGTKKEKSNKDTKKETTRRESIVGIVITLSVDGKEFRKQSLPENFIRRLEEQEERDDRKEERDDRKE